MCATPPGAETDYYDQQYPRLLGRLLANLSTLELNLRIALYLMDTPPHARWPPTWRIASLAVGDQVEECWLSSWSYLTQLINEYNTRQAAGGLELLDTRIADLRNALAHGQISSATPEGDGLPDLFEVSDACTITLYETRSAAMRNRKWRVYVNPLEGMTPQQRLNIRQGRPMHKNFYD